MEEIVGKWWHRLIERVARHDYPEAEVRLEEVRRQAGIVFRALGGDGGLRIEASTGTGHDARRSLAQRLAGSFQQVELAWRDDQTLRLPMSIRWFERRSLNLDLYLWLVALASARTRPSVGPGEWIRFNAADSAELLARLPGLQARYRRLVEAHLAQRPLPSKLPAKAASQERLIRLVLSDPESAPVEFDWPATRLAPMPVPLWLHPSPPDFLSMPAGQRIDDEDGQDCSDEGGRSQDVETDKRRRGERVDSPDGRDGLLAFRLESLFTRAEYVAVDRSTDENADEDARDALQDLEMLSVTSADKRPAKRLRFDLDLPAEAYDDIHLGNGIRLPEWDFRRQRLVADQCLLQELVGRDCVPQPLPAGLAGKARRMKRVFDLIQPRRTWLSGQLDGADIDIDALIDHHTDRRRGVDSGELRLYRQCRNNERDLACLLLADLSLSTDTYIDDENRVIDVIRDSLLLFGQTLASTRDRFALYGFSSRRREHVRFHTLKQFDERFDNAIIGRIMQLRPGYYTRIGAALRHASSLVEKTPSSKKLLLLLTDGKPNDLDRYEGRYGIEDTRQAVLECTRAGVIPFCVTIDDKASQYLPYLFGQSGYVRVANVGELPSRLPMIYARLTS